MIATSLQKNNINLRKSQKISYSASPQPHLSFKSASSKISPIYYQNNFHPIRRQFNEHPILKIMNSKAQNYPTTQQSTQNQESQTQQSRFFNPKSTDKFRSCENLYFNCKRPNPIEQLKEKQAGRLSFFQKKMKQMRTLVISHQKQLNSLSRQVSNNQLYRLVKIHSSQKLIFFNEIGKEIADKKERPRINQNKNRQ